MSTRFFFALALGSTWLLQLPALLAHLGVIPGPVERFMTLAGLGAFGPLVAAMIAGRREEPGRGARVVFRSFWIRELNPIWYGVALFFFPAIYLLARAIVAPFTEAASAHWLYLPENAQQVVAMLMIPLAEEPGWRGFALPRLQAKYGPLGATIVVGIAWAAWHIAMFLLATPAGDFAVVALSLVNIFVGAFAFTWLFNRTQGSLLVAILAHVGAHLNNPAHALPANGFPLALYTVAIGVAALATLRFDRAAWQRPVTSRAP